MKHLDFQDYSTTYKDDDGDEHETTIRAAKITDDLVYVKDPNTGNNVRREVMTFTGARAVQAGDVFVETERAGVYDFITGEQWEKVGYKSEEESRQNELDSLFDDDESDDRTDEDLFGASGESESDLAPETPTGGESAANDSEEKPAPVAKKAIAKRTLPSARSN